MIYWRKYFIIILGILFNIELSMAQHSDTSKVLLSKLELQFTNRFYYVRRYKIRDSSYRIQRPRGIYRIQIGYDVWNKMTFTCSMIFITGEWILIYKYLLVTLLVFNTTKNLTNIVYLHMT